MLAVQDIVPRLAELGCISCVMELRRDWRLLPVYIHPAQTLPSGHLVSVSQRRLFTQREQHRLVGRLLSMSWIAACDAVEMPSCHNRSARCWDAQTQHIHIACRGQVFSRLFEKLTLRNGASANFFAPQRCHCGAGVEVQEGRAANRRRPQFSSRARGDLDRFGRRNTRWNDCAIYSRANCPSVQRASAAKTGQDRTGQDTPRGETGKVNERRMSERTRAEEEQVIG